MFCPDVIKEICNPDVKSDGKYVSHSKKKNILEIGFFFFKKIMK